MTDPRGNVQALLDVLYQGSHIIGIFHLSNLNRGERMTDFAAFQSMHYHRDNQRPGSYADACFEVDPLPGDGIWGKQNNLDGR